MTRRPWLRRIPCRRPAAVAALVSLASLVTLTTVAAAWHGAPVLRRSGPDRAVGTGSAHPEVEPHLAVHPRDPGHLLAASITATARDLRSSDCTVFASFDGGATWSTTLLSASGHDSATCGDPWMAILPDGTALVSVLGDSGITVFRSPDGGRTWAMPLAVRGAYDHEMVVVDSTSGVTYLVAGAYARNARGRTRSALYVARSADGGRTFVPRGRHVVSNMAYEAQTPVVYSDGELMVPFMDHHDASDRRLERRRVWATRSDDGGVTLTEPALVSEGCNRQGPAAWPSFAVAPPGVEHRDRTYFVCEAHENRGILFATSDDRGERWSPSRRIDASDVRTDGGEAWTKAPSIAVSSGGVVAVTWYDRRDDPGRRCQHLYAAASLDGGATFLQPVRLSEVRSCPESDRNGAVAARFPGGGDYGGLVPVGPLEFVAVWADARGGHFQLRATSFVVELR